MKYLQIILVVSLLNTISSAQDHNLSGIGRNAPNFKLENLEKEIIELKSFVGTGPILVCFWSSCCRSAVTQLESFSFLFEKYSDDDLMLLAIATDDEKTIAKVKPYAKSKKYKFPVLYDTDNETARVYYAFDIPYSVLIDREGKIIYTHLGYMKGDEIELERLIIELLQNKK